jgi:hypothetical protein
MKIFDVFHGTVESWTYGRGFMVGVARVEWSEMKARFSGGRGKWREEGGKNGEEFFPTCLYPAGIFFLNI